MFVDIVTGLQHCLLIHSCIACINIFHIVSRTFSALTLGHIEEHPACKKLSDKVAVWRCGYLSGGKCG